MATRKVMIRLEWETYEEVVRLAGEYGTTISGFIRRAVEKDVEMKLVEESMIREWREHKELRREIEKEIETKLVELSRLMELKENQEP